MLAVSLHVCSEAGPVSSELEFLIITSAVYATSKENTCRPLSRSLYLPISICLREKLELTKEGKILDIILSQIDCPYFCELNW